MQAVLDNPAVGWTFVVYLSAMLVLGLVAYWRTRDLSDYILGGRSLSSGVTALSAGASDMSGWLLLGLPGYAYASGVEAGWIALGLLVGTYLNWRLVALRLRVYTQLADNALTLPDYFERRFADPSRLLRVISAFFVLLFFLFYTSSGLVAAGKLFNAVFGMPYVWAVAAGVLSVVAYTFVGGFLAVSWTDVVQGLLMALALVLVPLIGLAALGGWSMAAERIGDANPHLLEPLVGAGGDPLSAVALLSLIGWGLGYFGQPHILARFNAIHSPGAMPTARRIAMSWVAVTLLGAVMVGLIGDAYLADHLTGTDAEKVFMVLTATLLHPIPAGICLAAILAAIMSTADSQLLVASSALAEDFYKALLRPSASQPELVRIGRMGVLLIAAVAFLLALNPDAKVLELVAYAWAGFGAAFGPALLLSLYWPRMTRNGALAGILVGGITVVVWKQLEGGIFDLYELVPAFAFASLAVIVVSLLDKPAPSAVTEQFRQLRRAVQNGD